MPKKIIYVHFGRLTSGQANVIHVARMVDAFSNEKNKVTLIALVDKGFTQSEFSSSFGIKNEFIVKASLHSKYFIVNLLKLFFLALFATRLGLNGVIYTRSAAMAAALSILPRPLILELHAPLRALNSKLKNAIVFWLNRNRFQSIVLISLRLKNIFLEELSSLDVRIMPRIIVAHDGANICNIIDQNQNATLDKINIGYAGHLYPGRGIDLILECARRCSNYNFIIIGGTDSHVALWSAKARGITNLQFVGRVSPVDVEKYLNRCDILLAPYEAKVYTDGGAFETSEWMSPLKVFEYMASGRAIICSRLSVIEEVLTDGWNAKLCEPGSIDEWVSAIVQLAECPEERKRLGSNASNDLVRKYTWNQRVIDILQSSDL